MVILNMGDGGSEHVGTGTVNGAEHALTHVGDKKWLTSCSAVSIQEHLMPGRSQEKWATTGSSKYKWHMDGIWTTAVTRPIQKASHTSRTPVFLFSETILRPQAGLREQPRLERGRPGQLG